MDIFIKDNVSQKYYQFMKHRWYEMQMINCERYIARKLNVNVKDVDEIVPVITDFHEIRDPPHLFCFKNFIYNMNTHQFDDGNKDNYCTHASFLQYKHETNHHLLNNILDNIVNRKEFIMSVYSLFKGYPIIIYCKNKTFEDMEDIIGYVFGGYMDAIYENALSNHMEYLIHSKIKYVKILYEDYTNNDVKLISMSGLTHKQPKMVEIIANDFAVSERHVATCALQLVNKMIDLDQSPTKSNLFLFNTIFIQDVTNYILQLYDALLY